jgi:lysophospholipase L1-like esterase
VALGDSITYLNDHPKETYYRVRKGYMTRVCEQLPDLKYINHGYNGWTAVRIAQIINELNIQSAELYTIFLGTNDWWAGHKAGKLTDYINNTGVSTVAGAMRIITDHLKSKNPKAHIIFITPMQRADFVYLDGFKNQAHGSYMAKNGQELSEIVNLISEIAHYEKKEVVDLYNRPELSLDKLVNFKYLKNPESGKYEEFGYPEYTKIPFNADTDEYPYPTEAIHMTYDGLHPSDKGNELIAKLLIEKINNQP